MATKNEKSAAEEKPAAFQKEEKKTSGPVMYVGPTLPRYGLIQNTVYSEGIPEGGEKLSEDVPAAKYLFVCVTDYWKAEKELRAKSGAIYSAFAAAFKERR